MNFLKFKNLSNALHSLETNKIIYFGSLFTLSILVLIYSLQGDLWYIAIPLLILFLIVERGSFDQKYKGFYLLSIGALIVITLGQENIQLAMIALIALLTLFSNLTSKALNIISYLNLILFSVFTIGIVYFVSLFRITAIPLIIFLLLFVFLIIYFQYRRTNLQNSFITND